ncbi:MAG: hypothetical protein KF743_14150, partial [Fimbriimonadaceae bacterium]|nr:hypothetical protein [Fimbriimonadaceae bacterium]
DYTVRFRHYDPEIGRWLERDPAGYVDGMNRFAIAKCSPVTRADWSGLATVSDDNHRLSDIVYGLTDHERTIVTTSQNCGAWSARGARLTACGSSVLLVDHEVTKWIELRIAGPTLQGGGDKGPLAVFSWTTTGWTVLDGRFRHMNLRGAPCSYWVNVEVDCCRTCEVQHSCEVYKRDKTWREIWKYTGESHQYSGGSRTQCRKIKIKRQVFGNLVYSPQGTFSAGGGVPWVCNGNGEAQLIEDFKSGEGSCSGLDNSQPRRKVEYFEYPADGVGPPEKIRSLNSR